MRSALLAVSLVLLAAPATAEPQRVRVPDLPLVDQTGAAVSLPDQPGTVVLSFMFTTCETLCPITNAILAALDDQLADQGIGDVTILSITLDPTTDRPDVLRETAEAFGASPRWRFLTGDGATATAAAFGMTVYDIALHDPVIFIGDAAQGRFLRRFGNPSPDELLAAIREVSETR
ncbi:MAG: SCO family protein [Rhodobacteraceae bacterium]|jgi:protein SCO1/2|nr:SCO family protein [Paracoccaceae bacterium]